MVAEYPCNMPDPIPLSALKTGGTAVLHTHSSDREECAMLCAMGLTDRCELRICRQSGTCCIVQIASTRLALSRPVAERILVTPVMPLIPLTVDGLPAE